jgi:hypothetical protein
VACPSVVYQHRSSPPKIAVMVLCVYFGVRYYRASKPGPLLVVFYRDGTLYFVVVVGSCLTLLLKSHFVLNLYASPAMSVTNAIIALFIPVRFRLSYLLMPLTATPYMMQRFSRFVITMCVGPLLP